MESATQRSCDIQNNLCANAINSGVVDDADVSDCADQRDLCVAFAA